MSRVVLSLLLPLVTAVEFETHSGDIHFHVDQTKDHVHHQPIRYAVDAAGKGKHFHVENANPVLPFHMQAKTHLNTLKMPARKTHLDTLKMPAKMTRPDTLKMPAKTNLLNTPKKGGKSNLMNTPEKDGKSNLVNTPKKDEKSNLVNTPKKAENMNLITGTRKSISLRAEKTSAARRLRHMYRHQYRFKGVGEEQRADKDRHQNVKKTHKEKTSHVEEEEEEETQMPFEKARANLQARKPRSAAAFYRDNGSKKVVRKEVFHKENVNTQEEPSDSPFGRLDPEQSSVLIRDCTQGMEKSNTTTCPDVKLGAICESFYFVDISATNTEKYKACRFTADNECKWLGDTCNPTGMNQAATQNSHSR